MSLRTQLAAFVFFMVSASSVYAESFSLNLGMGGVADLGATDCAHFNDLMPIGPSGFRQAAMTWAQGYFYALSEGKTIDELLAEQETAWTFNSLTDVIVQYCEDNPEEMVPEAIKHLWQTLDSSQAQEGPDS